MSVVDLIEVICADIVEVSADLLVLKHANGFLGADQVVASRLGYNGTIRTGEVDIVPGHGIAAGEVAFRGIGPIYDFRYGEIEHFSREIFRLISEKRPAAKSICCTIHGVGYGLDEREAFLSQITGLIQGARETSHQIEKILIAEIDPARAHRLQEMLEARKFEDLLSRPFSVRDPVVSPVADALQPDVDPKTDHQPLSAQNHLDATKTPRVHLSYDIRSFGIDSEAKPKMFVAMPFADSYRDEYDIAFVEASHANSYICERLDLEHFTGDIVVEIERRITQSAGMIALLNSNNPNVFLEIGYAMALGKPIIFVVRKGEHVPFDIRNFKRIEYERIYELRKKLTDEIEGLTRNGVFVKPPAAPEWLR